LGRILAKVRCTELQEIPKSGRLTDGDNADSESWTFSIEVLQQVLLGAGPPDKDPLPDEGVDPHPLPPVIFDPQVPPVPPQNIPAQGNNDAALEENNWANNNQEMQMQDEPLENDQDNDVQSSVTLTFPMSAGGNSTNIQQMQQHANEEVNQQNNENFFVEEEIAPVIVQGDQHALNINNFQLLGEGVQNLMLAYQDLEEEDIIEPVANVNQDQEMEDIHSQGNVSDPNLEAF
jgi:hypothetical protein